MSWNSGGPDEQNRKLIRFVARRACSIGAQPAAADRRTQKPFKFASRTRRWRIYCRSMSAAGGKKVLFIQKKELLLVGTFSPLFYVMMPPVCRLFLLPQLQTLNSVATATPGGWYDFLKKKVNRMLSGEEKSTCFMNAAAIVAPRESMPLVELSNNRMYWHILWPSLRAIYLFGAESMSSFTDRQLQTMILRHATSNNVYRL